MQLPFSSGSSQSLNSQSTVLLLHNQPAFLICNPSPTLNQEVKKVIMWVPPAKPKHRLRRTSSTPF